MNDGWLAVLLDLQPKLSLREGPLGRGVFIDRDVAKGEEVYAIPEHVWYVGVQPDPFVLRRRQHHTRVHTLLLG
jgi:hypothetical protein